MSSTPDTTRGRAVAALLLACAFWGISFPISKALGAAMQATSAACLESTWVMASLLIGSRFLLGGFVVLSLHPKRPARSEIAQGQLLGVTTGAGMILQTDALAYTEASTGAFLTQGYVILLPLIGIWTNRRLPSLGVVVSALLVLVGLAVLARFDPRTLSLGRGEAETLLAALCFTFQILVLGHPRFARNRTLSVSWVMFMTIAVVAVALLVAAGGTPLDALTLMETGANLACFVTLTVLSTLSAFLLMNRFQPYVTPSEAGIIYATEPAFTSLFALFVPALLASFLGILYENEVLDARLLVGGGLVILANVVLAWWGARKE